MPCPAIAFDQNAGNDCVIHAAAYDVALRNNNIGVRTTRRASLNNNVHGIVSTESYVREWGAANGSGLLSGGLMSYRFAVEATGTYYFWASLRIETGTASMWWGIDGVQEGFVSGTQSAVDEWILLGSKAINQLGRHSFCVSPRTDDTHWRQLLVTKLVNRNPSGYLTLSGFRPLGNTFDFRCSGDWVDPLGHIHFNASLDSF